MIDIVRVEHESALGTFFGFELPYSLWEGFLKLLLVEGELKGS